MAILSIVAVLAGLWTFAASANPITASPSSSSATASATLVTTTAVDGSDTPPNHWVPDRPDPYVCEYLGENDCWQPSDVEEGPPYMGFAPDSRPPRNKTCVVPTHHDRKKDDAPAIRKAFEECRENAHIVFENTTYHISSVLNTTGLRNVDVELKGTLAWNNDNINYWLNNSLYIGFQNQTTAWLFGGSQVHFYGHGVGTFNGNGQVWYAYSHGTSNLHGRPHAIAFTASYDSVIEGINFIKAQMWTTTVAFSEKILLQDIYVNNSCVPGKETFSGCNLNTDGCDTFYANNITFLRWTIDNGDDSISLKQNSTNIYVADSTFYHGSGIALGSIGQYPGQIEIMANFTARNITAYHTVQAAYMKSWTGLHKGVPPNGGGGGYGHTSNITFDGFELHNVTQAWAIDQDQSYDGLQGGQNTSRFHFGDISFKNAHGTVQGKTALTFQCSGASPCTGISVENNAFTTFSNGSAADQYLCSNVLDPVGFTCTGSAG